MRCKPQVDLRGNEPEPTTVLRWGLLIQGFLNPMKRTLVAATLTAAACLAAFAAARSTILIDFEYRGYDLLVNAAGDAPPDGRIVIVDFDDAALDRIARFPVPRALVADTITAIAAGAPELIGLDLLLSEPRTPAEDAAMADALRRAGNVIIASLHASNQMLDASPLPQYCRPDPASPSACDQQSAAFGVGMINLPVDDDGFVRRVFLLPPSGYAILPFPVEIATNFRGVPLARRDRRTLEIGNTVLYPDRTGLNSALIGTWSRKPARTVSALDVVTRGFDARVFRGKIVLIGQSSAAAGDRHFTPLFRNAGPDGRRLMMPGTGILAAAITTVLDGRTVRVLAPVMCWSVTAGIVFVSLLLLLALRPGVATAVFLLVGGATYVLAQMLFSIARVWLPFIGAEAALAIALPAGLGYRFVRERLLKSRVEAERRQLMDIFSKYVSPEAAAEIWERRGEIELAGEEKLVTVMFTDIRGFTRRTAGKPSMEVLVWLNDYFSAMTEVTKGYGGFVNKFIGDGIMIVFGMPLSHGSRDDALNAVRAGLAMVDRVKRFNEEHADDSRYPPDLHIGVGVHTGFVVAGNVGAHDRLEYSAIGETVNLASRLESVTKELGVELVMSDATWQRVSDRIETRPLGTIPIRGLPAPICVYTASTAREP